MEKTNNKGGFTLIELLVVISIIALLSSVVLASVQQARQKAQISKAKSEIEEFVKALEIYRTAYGYYPTCVNGGNGCYFETQRDNLIAGSNSLGPLMQELSNKKVYNGDITKVVSGLPSSVNYISVYYLNTATELQGLNNTTSGIYCGDKKNFNSYVLEITTGTDNNNPNYLNIDLSNTYLSKERILDGSTPQGDGSYCTGV